MKEWLLDPELFEHEMSSSQMARWQQCYIQQPWGRIPERIAFAEFQNARHGNEMYGRFCDFLIHISPNVKKRGGSSSRSYEFGMYDWMMEGKPVLEEVEVEVEIDSGLEGDVVTSSSNPLPLGLQPITSERWKYVKQQADIYASAS